MQQRDRHEGLGTGPSPVPDPGFDPSDPASVAARRSEILAMEEAAAAMLAAGTALQLRAHAAAYDFGHALDVAEGCAESAMHVRSIANEVGLLVKLAAGTAQGHLASASVTLREFPALALALESNAATPAQVHKLVETGLKINHDDPAEQTHRRGEFVQVMLQRVRREPLPPAALQHAAERVAEELTGESIEQRHERAKQRRRVSVEDLGDGMSILRVLMSSFVAHAIRDRARKQSKAIIRARPKPSMQTPESSEIGDAAALDERTLDQVMSDVIADLLLTSDPTVSSAAKGIQATVQLSIPITTLLPDPARPARAPALLEGMSPMPIEDAKHLAATAPAFIRLLTHPITGALQTVDSYTPTAAMRAFLKARDIHCRFIGCRQPATNCELDHTIDHQYGGTTATWNLSDFCKNHHIIKHHTAWTVTQHDGGTLEWTTPSGKTYTDHPEPHGPTFTPTDQLPWRRGGKPPRERDEDPPPAAPSAPAEPPF
ncbi:hypothetical protein C5E06_07545 [Pseudoclavibacter sp. RFBI5]|uniref:HNH endonuclease signature motif containing protein n=1 Tax=Pseudoclavibacter sp. RFBI5 TaxID=2080578 RepID=UPI000CE7BD63|nr:HNH endonuclease signature motif containing protein [Pseudoclavibacter sp. RFBI5]PPG02337.1 hypothetical protein C5E06_07545 [Pseudoclavibacter sp. RFBI5]